MEEIYYPILGIIVSFGFSLIIGRFLIKEFANMKFLKSIREDGPQSHAKKNGTPTMGGIMFVLSVVFTCIFFAVVLNYEFSFYIGIFLVVLIGFALIGFVDDYLNVRKINNGLRAYQKLIFQFIIAGLVYYLHQRMGLSRTIDISSLNVSIELGEFYIVYILLVVVGFSNAVNITDGLDGLTGGLSIIAFSAFAILIFGASSVVADISDLAVASLMLVGGLLGFMFYNIHPAKIFMGDTGSLSLGGTLAIIAILSGYDLTLFIIGGVFIIEIISVIMQVASYKLIKRRVFLMAPLHHHFELLGWKETEIVKMFWILGFIFSVIGVIFGVIL